MGAISKAKPICQQGCRETGHPAGQALISGQGQLHTFGRGIKQSFFEIRSQNLLCNQGGCICGKGDGSENHTGSFPVDGFMPGTIKCLSACVQHDPVNRVEVTKQVLVKVEIIKTIVDILIQKTGHPGYSFVRLQSFCSHLGRVYPPTILANHLAGISFVNQIAPESIQGVRTG